MSKLTDAVALSGALDMSSLMEFTKWRLPVQPPDGEPYTSSEAAAAAIEDAMTSQDQVAIRATDPDAMRYFMQTKAMGRLRIVLDDAKQSFDWEYGMTPTGNYILQWSEGTDTDILCNGESHLMPSGQKDGVYFERVEDLYFGNKRVFILCFPRRAVA